MHLVYLGSGIFGQLRRKPYLQNLTNPLVEEFESIALMNIRGVGRPRKNPLNLSSNGKLKEDRYDVHTVSSAGRNLNRTEFTYLHNVINHVVQEGACHQDRVVTEAPGDSNSLFQMFLTPQDTEIERNMNIEGGKRYSKCGPRQ